MIPIGECTIIKPVTCTPDEKIVSAVKKLKKQQLRHLYVVDKKKNLLGVFSGLDLVYNVLAAEKDYRQLTVKACMKTDIVSFAREDPLTKAIGFMSHTSVFSCPILEKGKLIGVLSYKDAMAAVLKQKQLFQQKQQIR